MRDLCRNLKEHMVLNLAGFAICVVVRHGELIE